MRKRPKRRRDRFNPYKLERKLEKYIIQIENNNFNKIEVDEKIYSEMNKFELEDLSQMNEYDRHIEHIALNEEQINKRKMEEIISVEDLVINNIEEERLHTAILKLPEIQRKRIIMYYFRNMTQKEIALKEKTSLRAIQYSLNIALKNLKKFLN